MGFRSALKKAARGIGKAARATGVRTLLTPKGLGGAAKMVFGLTPAGALTAKGISTLKSAGQHWRTLKAVEQGTAVRPISELAQVAKTAEPIRPRIGMVTTRVPTVGTAGERRVAQLKGEAAFEARLKKAAAQAGDSVMSGLRADWEGAGKPGTWKEWVAGSLGVK